MSVSTQDRKRAPVRVEPWTEIAALREELAEARKDTEMLDWLEKVGFSTVLRGDVEKAPGVHCWRYGTGFIEWKWTAHWISSEFDSARAACRAAMEAKP